MIDLAKLAGQGRAYSGSRAWETEELDALIALERKRDLPRLVAADYVRNGVLTLEAYDQAVKAEFKPKTLEDAHMEVEMKLKDNEFATPKKVKGKK